jgi:Tol biopolymer transport system component
MRTGRLKERLREILPLLAVLAGASACRATVPIARGVDADFTSEDGDLADPASPAPESEPKPEPGPAAEPTPGLASEPAPEAAPESTVETAPEPSPEPTPEPPPPYEPPLYEPAPEPPSDPLAWRQYLQPRALTQAGAHGALAWDRDGRQIVVESVRSGGLVENPWPQVWLMDADGSRQRRVTMGIGKVDGPSFLGGQPRVLLYGSTHHSGQTPERVPGQELRPDPEMDLYVQDLDKGGLRRLTEHPGFDGDAASCDDGRTLAFVSERDHDPELYVLDLGAPAGTAPRRLTERPGSDHSPSISSTCASMLWVASPSRSQPAGDELVIAAGDGSARRVLLIAPRILDPAFHPRGDRIVFASDLQQPGGPLELFSIRVDGTDLRRLTGSPGSERHPRWSPDGRRIAWTWAEQGDPQVQVADYDISLGIVVKAATPAP